MNDEDLTTITSLLRATKAIVGIAENGLVKVKTTILIAGGEADSIDIRAWRCTACEEIHSEVDVNSTRTLVIIDPDEESDSGGSE